MPAFARRHRALIGACVLALGCAPGARATRTTAASANGAKPGVEIHAAEGRPRLVVVRREGDPSAAIAIELRAHDDDPFRLGVVAAIVSSRLEAAGFSGVQVIPGVRVSRVRALAPALGADLAAKLDRALTATVVGDASAVAAAREAIAAFAARPVSDPALVRAARCLDRPTRPPKWKAPLPDEVPTVVEALRVAQVRSDLVSVAAVGSGATDDLVRAWRSMPVFAGSVHTAAPEPAAASAVTISQGHEGAVVVVEGGPRAALPSALSSLVAHEGALASRLRAAEAWRLRGVAGAARPEGACVVVEVEPSPEARMAPKDWNVDRFANRAAIALEVARQEVELALEAARGEADDAAAHAAIGGGGDPREAADRAAWWAWPREPAQTIASTSTLEVPAAAIAKDPSIDLETALATLQPKLALAQNRAKLAWTKSEIELRGRVEAGQGELWAALGTPCGPSHEMATDAGLASIAARALAAAHATRASDGVSIEPWSAPTGIGVVAHAAPRAGEAPSALAHRVGDALGRLVLASFPEPSHVASARGEALVGFASHEGAADLVRVALRASTPLHPSWLEPLGTQDAVAKIGLEAVELRLDTLRAGPLRLAVIANVEDAQLEAAARAAERWVPRRPGETRACPLVDPGTLPSGGLHPLTVKAGTGVALAFPVDEPQREAAAALAAVLDGKGGRLALDVGDAIATAWEARLVRGVGRHALVIVVLAPDPNVDAVVTRVRALLEKLRTANVDAADLARAEKERAAAYATRRLDPRARLVDLFAGESTSTPVDAAQLKATAAKIFEEDKAQVVVARLAK